MNSNRLYLVLCVTIGLLIAGLIVGTYGANNLLASQANQLTTLKAKSQALAQEQLVLAKAKKQVQQYADLDQIAHTVVPQDKNQAEAVREIVNLASANQISLASISFPASTLGNGAHSNSSSGVATPSAGASSPSSSASSTAGALSQLLPVKNIPGVYLLQITVSSDPNEPVPYSQVINFLSGLEHNRRTAQVSSIVLQPDTSNRSLLSFTLALNEYIKP